MFVFLNTVVAEFVVSPWAAVVRDRLGVVVRDRLGVVVRDRLAVVVRDRLAVVVLDRFAVVLDRLVLASAVSD